VDARPAAPPIRVILADDHAMVRRTMRLLLDREQDIHVSAEASSVSSVVEHVGRHSPHVLVLDLRLPNGSSIETIRRLRAHAPDVQIIVLTMEDRPQFAQQALDAGAIGFVLKDRADDELVAAVRLASRGEEYVSPRVAAGLEALERGAGKDILNGREMEILRLIALGFTSREIADKLHLSRRTVETHRSRIHSKLGLATRAELVRFVLDRHLLA
jgi:two-component system, NarL family, response regulator NreC